MAGKFRVRVDKTDHEVAVEWTRSGCGQVTVGNTTFEVVLGPDGRVMVRPEGGYAHHTISIEPSHRPHYASLGGRTHAVSIMTAAQAALADARGTAQQHSSSGELCSPMPGRVVRVLVQQGQEIGADVPAVIVEAMKMENEVRTTVAGLVSKVSVTAGDTVDVGQLLCTVVAHPESS